MTRTIPLRTHTCGELTEKNTNDSVVLTGWVHKVRNLGSLLFLDLRDRWGVTQIIFDLRFTPTSAYEMAQTVRLEDVIAIKGRTAIRENPNNVIVTGKIEIQAADIQILSKAKVSPFPIADESSQPHEELRSRYRYLDMRKGELIQNLLLRHSMMQIVRKHLSDNQFIEVSTPFLGKSTPEGARDYLVPSRIHPGSFYALPQSPQMFKQILMVGGLDRYFQIATCFRDEDLRADRQPEFQQIDIEMSFATDEELFPIIENLMITLFKESRGVELPATFPRMTHQEAAERYGSDKPDLRFDMPIIDFSDLALNSTCAIFQEALNTGGTVRGLLVKSCASMSRKELEEYAKFISQFGCKGLSWMKYQEGDASKRLHGPISKYIEDEQSWIDRCDASPTDLFLLIAGNKKKTLQALDHLRRRLAKDLNLIPNGAMAPVWITDFPLFSWNEEFDRIESEHHPFTSPHLLDLGLFEKKPLQARSSSYDLVLNGYEIASGSQRIHDSEVQEKIFSILGMEREERDSKFGFFIEALQYGTPPHLGIALGFDRLVMVLAGTENIRDVIAFPKNQKAVDVMTSAPADVREIQLKELQIRVANRP